MAHDLKPTSEDARLFGLDAARGFALFGVLMVNYSYWFVTWPLPHPRDHVPGLADHAVSLMLPLFFEGRFMGLFAFLFGVGLTLQAERARAGWFIARRMLVLFLLGALHVLLLWSGDILHIYAVVGLLLLVTLLRRTPRTIAIVAGVLLSLPMIGGLVGTIVLLATGSPGKAPVPPAELKAHMSALAHVLQNGSLLELAQARVEEYVIFVPARLFAVVVSFTMAALGVWAWKRGIFTHVAEHRRLLRRVAVVGMLVGPAQAGLGMLVSRVPELHSFVPLVLGSAVVAQASMTFAYAAIILLVVEHERGRRLFARVAAVGRMALSNYLMHSVIGTLIFYGPGLGLYDRLGPAAGAVIVVAVYATQLAYSPVWLRHFRFGPVEWLWRTLSYGRVQRMRSSL